MLPYIFVFIAVSAIAGGQLLFKTTANKMSGRPIVEAILQPEVFFPFVIAVIIYAGATVFWILALRDLALGRAYMFMSMSFIIVPTLSVLLFSETLGTGFIIGMCLIMAGVFVTQYFG